MLRAKKECSELRCSRPTQFLYMSRIGNITVASMHSHFSFDSHATVVCAWSAHMHDLSPSNEFSSKYVPGYIAPYYRRKHEAFTFAGRRHINKLHRKIWVQSFKQSRNLVLKGSKVVLQNLAGSLAKKSGKSYSETQTP